MSKKIVKILALVLMVALLAGCGSSGDKNGAGKKQYVCCRNKGKTPMLSFLSQIQKNALG